MTRENREILYVRKAREARTQAERYRSRAVDAMNWRQFQAFNERNVVLTKSKKILRWIDLEKTCREEANVWGRKLDALLSFEVIDGGRLWGSGNPTGKLALVVGA